MKKLLKIFKKDKSHEGLSTYQELHDSHYNLNNEVGLINEELKDLGKQVSEHEWNTDTDDLKKDVKKLNNKLTNALGKIQKLSIEIKSLQEADKKLIKEAKDVQQQMMYEYVSFSEKMDQRIGNTNSEVHRLNHEIKQLKNEKD